MKSGQCEIRAIFSEKSQTQHETCSTQWSYNIHFLYIFYHWQRRIWQPYIFTVMTFTNNIMTMWWHSLLWYDWLPSVMDGTFTSFDKRGHYSISNCSLCTHTPNPIIFMLLSIYNTLKVFFLVRTEPSAGDVDAFQLYQMVVNLSWRSKNTIPVQYVQMSCNIKTKTNSVLWPAQNSKFDLWLGN